MNNLWNQLIDGRLPLPFDTDKNSVPMTLDMYFYNILKGKDYLIVPYKEFLKTNSIYLIGHEQFLEKLKFLHNMPTDYIPQKGLIVLKNSLIKKEIGSKIFYEGYVTEYLKYCHPNINAVTAASSFKQNKEFNNFLKTGQVKYEP